MTGTTSSISLASNALLLLGHETIASFDEGTAGATIAANLYETSYLSLLTNHRWRFATKKAQLARLVDEPLNEYKYAFQLPSDCIYLIKTTSRQYQIYGSKIYSNYLTMEADYIYRVGEDNLPPYFSKMFEFFLASQFAVPLTRSIDLATLYGGFYSTALKSAKFADSTQHPQVSFVDNPYVEVRY